MAYLAKLSTKFVDKSGRLPRLPRANSGVELNWPKIGQTFFGNMQSRRRRLTRRWNGSFLTLNAPEKAAITAMREEDLIVLPFSLGLVIRNAFPCCRKILIRQPVCSVIGNDTSAEPHRAVQLEFEFCGSSPRSWGTCYCVVSYF
jgi:hypothetical protein